MSIGLGLALLLIPGCPPPPDGPGTERAVPETVDYAPIRRAYNERVDRIDQFWSRVVVEINWTDERKKSHFEQGDGQLIVRKPRNLALAIGKLGEPLLWIGGDADRFWLLELKPPEDKPPRAAVGRHADIGKPGMPELPLPFPPDQLVTLLGITALPEATASAPILATRQGSGKQAVNVVTLPLDPARPALIERIQIDPVTHHPTAITILDGQKILADAKLSEYGSITIAGKPPGAFPDIALCVDVALPARSARLKLFISDAVDGKANGKIKDAQFNFDALVQRFKPNPVRKLEPQP